MELRFITNIKSDSYYISKVIENIDIIDSYIKDIDFDTFVSDNQLVDAVLFRLVQMAENTSRISAEFKQNHPNIKWGLISGFRNGIVHEYGKTDFTIVYEIINEHIKQLKENLMN